MKCKPYGSSISKSRVPSEKDMVYYSKHKTYKSEILHIILNMFSHYNRIDVLKLRLLEEPGAETFVVPNVLIGINRLQITFLNLQQPKLFFSTY